MHTGVINVICDAPGLTGGWMQNCHVTFRVRSTTVVRHKLVDPFKPPIRLTACFFLDRGSPEDRKDLDCRTWALNPGPSGCGISMIFALKLISELL